MKRSPSWRVLSKTQRWFWGRQNSKSIIDHTWVQLIICQCYFILNLYEQSHVKQRISSVCWFVHHKSGEPFLRSSSHSARLSMWTDGSAASSLVQFRHVTHFIFQPGADAQPLDLLLTSEPAKLFYINQPYSQTNFVTDLSHEHVSFFAPLLVRFKRSSCF